MTRGFGRFAWKHVTSHARWLYWLVRTHRCLLLPVRFTLNTSVTWPFSYIKLVRMNSLSKQSSNPRVKYKTKLLFWLERIYLILYSANPKKKTKSKKLNLSPNTQSGVTHQLPLLCMYSMFKLIEKRKYKI